MVLPPSNAVLVLIDVQYAIDDPSWGRRNNPDAEEKIAALLHEWRRRGAPIVHVKHVSREPMSTFRPGQRGVELKPECAPQDDERIIVKHTPSAFAQTALERVLRDELRTDALVLTGFITNNSVETTARVASTHGFRVWVVRDATATFDRVDLAGRAWSADDVHALSLSSLSGEYAEIVDAATLLRAGA